MKDVDEQAEDKNKPTTEEQLLELTGWDELHCTECDAAIGFFPPEIKFHGDELPVYCFQCAVCLSKEH